MHLGPHLLCAASLAKRNTIAFTHTHKSDTQECYTHNSQSWHDSTCPYSNTCPDGNWGQRKETTGWFSSCARGKEVLSSYLFYWALSDGAASQQAGLASLALWTETNGSAASLIWTSQETGACSASRPFMQKHRYLTGRWTAHPHRRHIGEVKTGLWARTRKWGSCCFMN